MVWFRGSSSSPKSLCNPLHLFWCMSDTVVLLKLHHPTRPTTFLSACEISTPFLKNKKGKMWRKCSLWLPIFFAHKQFNNLNEMLILNVQTSSTTNTSCALLSNSSSLRLNRWLLRLSSCFRMRYIYIYC